MRRSAEEALDLVAELFLRLLERQRRLVLDKVEGSRLVADLRAVGDVGAEGGGRHPAARLRQRALHQHDELGLSGELEHRLVLRRPDDNVAIGVRGHGDGGDLLEGHAAGDLDDRLLLDDQVADKVEGGLGEDDEALLDAPLLREDHAVVRKADELLLVRVHHLLELEVLLVVDVVASPLDVNRRPAPLLLVEEHLRRLRTRLEHFALVVVHTPRALDLDDAVKVVALHQLLDVEDRLGVSDEQLGPTELPLGRLDLLQVLQNHLAALARVACPLAPAAPRLGRELLVAREETLERLSESEAGTPDLDVLEQTKVLHLMAHTVLVPVGRALVVVRLDAADVVRLARRQRLHQQVGRVLDLEPGGGGALLLTGAGCLFLGGDRVQGADERVAAVAQTVHALLEQGVLVLVAEAVDGVRHIAGVVDDAERAVERLVVLVLPVDRGDLLEELVVGALGNGVQRGADVVEKEENAGGLLAFDEVAHDLVVEELDGRPLDAFRDVLLLLLLQGLLDEVLLQLLVDVVDAELLEAVALEDLKAKDIENADGARLGEVPAHERIVHTLDQVVEHAVVQVTGNRIPRAHGLVHIHRRLEDLGALSEARLHVLEEQALLELLGVDLQHRRGQLDWSAVADAGVALVVLDKGDVAAVQDARDDREDGVLLLLGDPDGVHGFDGLAEVGLVVDVVDVVAVALVHVMEVLRIVQLELLCHALIRAVDELVEDVVVALPGLLVHHTGLLQQVVGDAPADGVASVIKVDFHVLAETTRVVVANGLGVAERLQQRVRVQDNALDVLYLFVAAGDLGDVLHDLLSSHRLAGTGLARDDAALVHVLALHISVRLFGKGKDVRGQFVAELAAIQPDVLGSSQAKILVRVDDDQHRADVGVDGVIVVTFLDVVDNVRFCDLWKHDKIVNALLGEPLFGLELGNLLCRISLFSLKSSTLSKTTIKSIMKQQRKKR